MQEPIATSEGEVVDANNPTRFKVFDHSDINTPIDFQEDQTEVDNLYLCIDIWDPDSTNIINETKKQNYIKYYQSYYGVESLSAELTNHFNAG